MQKLGLTLSVDLRDAKQKEAMLQLIEALTGNEQEAPALEAAAEEPVEDKPKRKRAPRKPKPKPEPVVETEEEEDLVGDDETEVKLDLATLRTETSAKAKKYRKEIKEKLAELGASNVSSIQEDDFQEYYDFLQEL